MFPVIKRVLPFVLTFALGLFVASFFVSLTAPNFNRFNKRHEYKQRRNYACESERRLSYEREAARAERERFRAQREAVRRNSDLQALEKLVSPPPPVAPNVPRAETRTR